MHASNYQEHVSESVFWAQFIFGTLEDESALLLRS